MNAIWVAICSLVILLGFEMRYRLTSEEISEIKRNAAILEAYLNQLRQQLKLKKDAFEEINPQLKNPPK